MSRTREKRPQREMKPVFLVFCEGETEENYIDFVRRTYKSPIKLIPKTEGNRISNNLISKLQQKLKISRAEHITTFLMYDLDVAAVNEKLKKCKAVWLCSNPCIELWFLLHEKEQKVEISTQECLDKLKRSDAAWHNYNKPVLTNVQKEHLLDFEDVAVERAKALTEKQNPSSTVYKLLEMLNDSKSV